MKRIWTLIIACGFFFSQVAFAGEVGFRYNSNTGDQQLDLSLGELNIKAKGDMDTFVKRLSLSYGVHREKLEMLIYKQKMPPADVYMTVKVSKISNKPIDLVINEHKASRGKGWGVIAKRLGIKPGSKAFHALKKDDSGILSQQGKAKKGKEKRPKKIGKRNKN